MTPQQVFRNTLIVIATFVAAYVVYQSVHILVVMLIAIIVASAVRPAVVWLVRHHFARALAALVVYGILGISLFTLSALIIPPITSQFAGYLTNDQSLPNQLISAQTWIETTASTLTGTQVKLFDPEKIRQASSDIINQVVTSLPTLAGGIGGLFGDFILVVIIGLYWLTARDQALDFVMGLFSMGRQSTIETITTEIEDSLGNYTRGIIMVAAFVGIANFIILSLFHVPSAATLGFIMGITTILPLVGGYIGAGISTLLALLSSPVNALIALGSFVAVQQVENHFLTPRVMSRSVGLNPILIILFLFVGAQLGGVVGALIAVPIAGTIMVLVRHLIIEPRKNQALPQIVEGGVLLESSPLERPNAEKAIPTESVIQIASH
ncbi:MAG: AI-2E family transporter [Aggregatilineales bacterium]